MLSESLRYRVLHLSLCRLGPIPSDDGLATVVTRVGSKAMAATEGSVPEFRDLKRLIAVCTLHTAIDVSLFCALPLWVAPARDACRLSHIALSINVTVVSGVTGRAFVGRNFN